MIFANSIWDFHNCRRYYADESGLKMIRGQNFDLHQVKNMLTQNTMQRRAFNPYHVKCWSIE